MAGSGGVPVVLSPYDLNELTNKQGAQNKYSNTGKIFFLDDFGSGIEVWEPSAWSMVSWEPNRSVGSGFSCHIELNAIHPEVQISKRDYPYVLASQYCGAEFSFQMYFTDRHTAVLTQRYNSANVTWHAAVVIYTQRVIIIGPNNTQVVLDDPPYINAVDTGYFTWNFCKLIVDWNTRRYHRLYINEKIWDLSMFPLYQFNSANVSPYLDTFVSTAAIAPGTQDILYVGHVRLTTDESE